MRRWNLWSAGLAVVLTTGVYALDRLLGVDPVNALVDAAVAGLICFVILEYWKGGRSGGMPLEPDGWWERLAADLKAKGTFHKEDSSVNIAKLSVTLRMAAVVVFILATLGITPVPMTPLGLALWCGSTFHTFARR